MLSLILATAAPAEGAEGAEAAASAGSSLPFILLIAALGAFAVAYVFIGRDRKGAKRRGDIPLAMRPYHSDAELETTGIERAMSWGVALAVFLALFIPLYWVLEPDRVNDARDELYDEAVAQGRTEYQNACATCHGADLQGGAAQLDDPNVDISWPAPALHNIVARYRDSETITDIRDYIETTLYRGRPGTPMPTWGAGFGGTMNDEQIQSITEYILSVQEDDVPDVEAFAGASGEELFENNCARCHGLRAEGYVGPSLLNVFERYGDSSDAAGGSATDEVRDFIRLTLNRGRYVPTGAPMPSFADRLDDSAMTRIIDYLAEIQQDDVDLEDARVPSYYGGEPGNTKALYDAETLARVEAEEAAAAAAAQEQGDEASADDTSADEGEE